MVNTNEKPNQPDYRLIDAQLQSSPTFNTNTTTTPLLSHVPITRTPNDHALAQNNLHTGERDDDDDDDEMMTDEEMAKFLPMLTESLACE